MNKLRVGWIGAGLMGHGAAKHILEHGYQLSILGHQNRQSVENLVGRGATEVYSPSEIVDVSDVVFLCVRSTADVERLMLGPQGIIEAARPGVIVVDTTTSDPDSTRRLGEMLAIKGCGMVDGPLGRSPAEAEAGRLSTFVGGNPDHVEKVRPIIECYAEVIVPTGELGSAHTMKLVNNSIAIGILAVIAETLACASKLGIDMQTLFRVVSSGGANSTMFQLVMPWVLDGDDSRMRARLSIPSKDMRAYCRLADGASVPTPLAQAINQMLMFVDAQGYGDRLMPVLPGILADMIGAPIRPLE